MLEALFYETRPKDRVKCLLCPRECLLSPGKVGVCRVRENRDGRLFTRNFARVAAQGLDPIEKKPLYHFYPGSTIFSLGTFGCNFACQFCQNWSIAQAEPTTGQLSPKQAVELTLAVKAAQEDCIGLAYTYSEPLVWYEYVRETALQAQQAGLKNVLVTNGFVREEPLKELLPFLDALNVDVKAFTPDFYQRWCKGDLDPVLRTVELAVPKCHVEITTLLIPGLNDSEAEISSLVEWVAGLSEDIPLHFSRYFPNYRLDLPPTPLESMQRAYALAREKLHYVYLGNLPAEAGKDTCCPQCSAVLIKRRGYFVEIVGLKGRKCTNCGEIIKIVI